MPGLIEHCKHALERYGTAGEDIHKWMDEPIGVLGGYHRAVRHNPNQEVPLFAKEKYGDVLARNIILDHVLLDGNICDEKEVNDDLIIQALKQRWQWKNREKGLPAIILDLQTDLIVLFEKFILGEKKRESKNNYYERMNLLARLEQKTHFLYEAYYDLYLFYYEPKVFENKYCLYGDKKRQLKRWQSLFDERMQKEVSWHEPQE